MKKSHKEENLSDSAEFRMFDDIFMAAVFDNQLKETQVLIRTILGRDDITVTESKAEDSVPNPHGRGVRLDILARDDKGNAYNFEVQRENSGASPKRARYIGAMVDSKLLQKGEDYPLLPDRYTIFITEKDYFGKKKPLYHAETRVKELGNTPLGDGVVIVYVNGAYQNKETPIGRLMHDFSCRNSSDIINPLLRNRVQYLKDYKGGQDRMCEIMERRVKERWDEGIEELVKDAIKDGQLSHEYIAKMFKLPLSTVEEIVASMQEKKKNKA